MLTYHKLIESESFVTQCKKKAEELELEGNFNHEVNENTMDNAIPVDETFTFIKKGFIHNLKKFFYLKALKFHSKQIAKYLHFKVKGKENLKELNNKGAIITCNHISLFDSFAIRYAVENDIMYIAAEFNNWKGKMGDIARHTGYLPITNKLKCIRKLNEALEYYLTKKHKKVLIFPEQTMWRNYTKPRPMKNGAFHYATKYNVPILPVFITFRNSGLQNQGGEILYYTVNILKPIYPQKKLNKQQNVDFLRITNFNQNKQCYEQTYKKQLEYTTKDKSKIII